MASSPVTTAHHLLEEGVAALRAARRTGSVEDRLSALLVNEGIARELAVEMVDTVAELHREGVFTERGYKTPVGALTDFLGMEPLDARLRVIAAEHVGTRSALDGTPLPPRLPATAAVFTACQISIRHVDVIAKVLASKPAGRLAPEVWAAAEVQLAAHAPLCATATELFHFGTDLIERLDHDGPEPDDRDPEPVNELTVKPFRHAPGGKLEGRYDSAELFAAIATVIDAHAAPRTADDQRSAATRNAEALAAVCAQVLDHGDVPDTGGQRPQVTVLIRLEDLEQRARAAMLDFGGSITPSALRMLACDAGVIPMVLGSTGEPLDVGRMSRTATLPIRRAVAARDRGCARPGCNRPPSWCHVHHVTPWENGGATDINNCVMLCALHHREAHMGGWEIRIRDGIPEFLPPTWIDPQRKPRRKPSSFPTAA